MIDERTTAVNIVVDPKDFVMPGFKQTILSHAPKLLLTFDGDAFDENTRMSAASPQVFLDESGFGSNIMLHNEDPNYPAYRMGIPSLVDLEQTDQHACSFGWYGVQPNAITRWPKAFVEVQHQSHLALTENHGSYTVGFFVYKSAQEENWRTYENALGNPYWISTLDKRWARKAGAFDIYYRDYWNVDSEIRFKMPGGTEIYWTVPNWFYQQKNFVVCTWSVTETDPDVYLCEAKLYVNGHLYASYSTTSSGTYPSSTNTSAIEIAGTINAEANYQDRQTNDTRFDQLFVLNKALTQDEVCRLYRKSKTYDNIALLAQAQSYWTLADTESAAVFTMKDSANYKDGVYQGGITRIQRQQPGPSTNLGSLSTYFHDGGMAAAHRIYVNGNWYEPLFNFTGDFTVHLWVKFENTDRSVIWSAQEEDYPHKGIVLEANRRNNITQPGHLQFSISQDYQVSSMLLKDNGDPYNFNDGRFHHVAMVRKGSTIYLWIDGQLHGSLFCPVQSIQLPNPGQVYFMGMSPGHLNTTGYLSSVGVFSYAMDPAEIRMLNTYSLIYRIQGAVTLAGNPHMATVRAYNHRTGNLTSEVLSDTNAGTYRIDLYDNSLIDLMVMNKQDPNIRYRVYGPITPAVYEDAP